MDLGKYWASVKQEADTLIESGEIIGKPVIEFACPSCEDLGWFYPMDMDGNDFPVGHPYHNVMLPCRNPECIAGQRAREQYRNARLAKSELDASYRNMTFESWLEQVQNQRGKFTAFFCLQHYADAWRNQHQFKLRPAWEHMCDYLNRDQPYTGDDVARNWMVLFGPVGTTKTGLTAAFMNSVLEQGGDATWHKFDTLLRRARKAIDSDEGASMDSVLQAYANAPMLILDEFKGANMLSYDKRGKVIALPDVGITELTRFERNSAELILNTRYNAGLPTLLTTNSDVDGVEQYWGQLIADRLKTAHWIPVMGGNERPKPPKVEAL